MDSKYNNEQIAKNIEVIFNLEFLGIRMEDIKELKDPYGISDRCVFHFSVPESSILDVKNEELNNRIKTADGLKRLAKEVIIDMVIDSCKREFSEDAEFIEEIKNNISDYYKFYAKVRSGEVWNKELGVNRIKELNTEMQKLIEYKEI